MAFLLPNQQRLSIVRSSTLVQYVDDIFSVGWSCCWCIAGLESLLGAFVWENAAHLHDGSIRRCPPCHLSWFNFHLLADNCKCIVRYIGDCHGETHGATVLALTVSSKCGHVAAAGRWYASWTHCSFCIVWKFCQSISSSLSSSRLVFHD